MIKKWFDFYAKLSAREKKILIGMLAVVSAVLIDRGLIHPVSDRLKRLEQSIVDEKAAIRKNMHVLLQKNRIEQDKKELSSFMVQSLDPEQEMTSLLKEIEQLANEASVSLSYVKPATTQEEGRIRKFFASMECEAEMRGVTEFFYRIESSPKLLKIEKFTIQPKSKDSIIARCVVEVSKTVFF